MASIFVDYATELVVDRVTGVDITALLAQIDALTVESESKSATIIDLETEIGRLNVAVGDLTTELGVCNDALYACLNP